VELAAALAHTLGQVSRVDGVRSPAPRPGRHRERSPNPLGHSNQGIAGRLSISEATVKSHIDSLFSKMGVRDRAQAVRHACGHGLAHPQS
jgi:hypothetical protein